LTWETGEGRFLDGEDPDIVPAPKVPPGAELEVDPADVGGGGSGPVLGEGTEANILNAFETTQRGDAGSFSTPPDHELAVGPQHVVVVVNRAIEMFDKSTGALEFSSSLGAFMPGSNGDPRIVFDQYSGRFIVLATDFSSRIFLAVSTSDDPLDPWYKTDFVIAQGTDEGTWPDHPTLGVDANGIYTASYMVGGTAGMTLVVIDKAPLISDTPSLGTVTAFRNLAFDGAIQPVHSYGETTGEYVISRFGAGGLRVRRIDGPLTSPTLLNLGVIDVPSFSSPPDISALGTSTPLDSVDTRLFSAMYRDGLIWTAHCTGNGTNRSIARWYAVDPVLMALVQTGVVSDPVNSFLFPTIAVDVFGNAVLGATICGPNLSPSACFVSRAFSDPAGVMSDPVIFRDGSGSNFDIIDQFGRNRWGDYSMTVADPDGFSVWTVQEYVHGTNVWGTHVAQAQVLAPPANNFCSAGQLLEPEPTAFTTQFATTDPFAATTCGEVSSDVWYRFPVTREGDLHISFGDVTFDAVVAIYDTFCPDDENDTPIACVTVENGSVDLVVPVQPNLYRIRIGSPTGAQGTGVLDAFVDAPLPCRGDCAPKNIDGSFGNGTVDVDDILAVINVMFTTSDGACDLSPDNGDGTFGNGIINVDDLFAVLQAVGDC